MDDEEIRANPIFRHHQRNLNEGTFVKNEDGSISTVYTTIMGDGEYEYLIPQVWDGKILNPEAAWQRAMQSGIDWPRQPSGEEGVKKLEELDKVLHEDMADFADGGLIKRNLSFNKGGLTVEKQMELFNNGGLYDEGGMIDEVSGNDVPPGSTRSEVRDDIPAMLSEGEFVFPADVVRYFGLEKLMEMRQQAKMGMKKMEAMGQMGNSEEATIPDDLPFSPEDLILMQPQEFARGGVVKAQAGMFVQPSGFQDASLNTPNFIPPSSIAPVNPQGTPTGYGPTFLGQSPIVPTGQNETITQPSGTGTTGSTGTTDTTGTDFVPTVADVYEFRKYINPETGEIRDIPFYMGQPVTANNQIPEGFIPYVEEEQETATEDVTDVGVESTSVTDENDSNDNINVGVPTNTTAPPVTEMTDEFLQNSLSIARRAAQFSGGIAAVVNPALGAILGVASRARYNDMLEEAQRRGLDTGGAERLGSIFGGESGLYEGLTDQSGDKKVSFADTWLGDLLGLDGKAGVQGPGLQESRRGARRGGTTTTTAATSGGGGGGARAASPVPTPRPAAQPGGARPEGPAAGLPAAPTGTTAGVTPAPTRRATIFNQDGTVAGSRNPDGTINTSGQDARPRTSVSPTTSTSDDRDDNNDMFSGRDSRASSAEKALETSRAGTQEVLSGIASRGKEQGKSENQITNELVDAVKESSRVEGALKDISRGVQRGFNKGGLASRKQITNNNPVNKDRGVAARKKK